MTGVRLVVSGGGTGGHVYPALAIAAAVRQAKPGTEVLYLGTSNGVEATLAPQAGFAFAAIPSRGMIGKGPLGLPGAAWSAFRGVLAARRILARFRPHVVVGTGGYVSGPVAVAALLGRVPLIVHEQNVFPGVTNRWASRWAVAVAVPYAEARRHFPRRVRLVTTGNPIRSAIVEMTADEGRRVLGLPDGGDVIYLVGGSLGAKVLNEAVVAAMPGWLSRSGRRIVFATGQRYYEETRQALSRMGIDPAGDGKIILVPYLHRADAALAAAGVVVTRAGGTTLAEVTARGLPAVVVPSPNVTHDHQSYNARALGQAGAAIVIAEADLTGEVLRRAVEDVLTQPGLREKMSRASLKLGRPGAADEIARLVLSVAKAAGGRGRPMGGAG